MEKKEPEKRELDEKEMDKVTGGFNEKNDSDDPIWRRNVEDVRQKSEERRKYW